jgi:membrane-bound lytic murein transglycosylase A
MKSKFYFSTSKLLIISLFLLLPLQACNNQKQVKQEEIKPPQQEPKKPPSVIPLFVQTQLPKDENYFLDDQIWSKSGEKGDKDNLLKAIDGSLNYLKTNQATVFYSKYIMPEITRERVEKSLVRFRELLVNSKNPKELQQAVNKEFVFYKSIGSDKKGTVLFTGYYKPIYKASKTPTAEYRYPIYRLPPDFDKWEKPHPTRLELEGKDALQSAKGKLKGLELFWLPSRMDAYLAQVQGSAVLKFTDGSETTINYAGNTDHEYTSLGKELIKDKKLEKDGITLQKVIDYFVKNPAEENTYLPRNPRFIFFKDTKGAPASGSLSEPITQERSIATDKSLMPPGALAIIRAPFPFITKQTQGNKGNKDLKNDKDTKEKLEQVKLEQRLVSRYVLDQDTGGAIKSPGRVDYYMGVGNEAGDRAGAIVNSGELYYLLLK